MLDDAELATLVEHLRTVAWRTLAQGALTYAVFSGERERLSQSTVTLISETATGRPIAFNALAQMPLTLNGDSGEPRAGMAQLPQTRGHLGGQLLLDAPEGASQFLFGR